MGLSLNSWDCRGGGPSIERQWRCQRVGDFQEVTLRLSVTVVEGTDSAFPRFPPLHWKAAGGNLSLLHPAHRKPHNAWAGRDLWDHLIPPLPRQGHLPLSQGTPSPRFSDLAATHLSEWTSYGSVVFKAHLLLIKKIKEIKDERVESIRNSCLFSLSSVTTFAALH